ncbi:MAG TPA: glucans biosynthesis glucosyltransferase MdoH [Thermodesulfobacteriota bacterium]|nr:glucans biosynthesis glucosyltransferase MdoH [Thermodesulfobacteriota bacterium]
MATDGFLPKRRRVFFFAVGATSIPGIYLLVTSLLPRGISALEWVQLVVSSLLLTEISFYFWTFFFGFLVLFRKTRARRVLRLPGSEEGADFIPTALVMPIHNEEPRRVFAGLRAIADSIASSGLGGQYHLHILSDTQDPILQKEEELWSDELGRAIEGVMPVFYRNRRPNTGRKMGNIRDFCNRFGADYEYMIVLDADSVMTGETMAEMVRRMDSNPDAALIQVPAYPVNKKSLFARLQQFAAAAYGPMIMAGLRFWQQGEGNYWGHNAIIRIHPFMEHCELPPLPGREPFGGEIWSHDFLEAAMLRRAGWDVLLASDLAGSYEEVPPTIVDYAKRDRRWCQGNLQHLSFLFAPGFHPISRLHLLMGILSYLTSPFWFILLAVTGAVAVSDSSAVSPMGVLGRVSEWPMLLGLVIVLLFSPRVLALLLILRRRAKRDAFGGGGKAVVSVILETLFAFVLAPMIMMFKTQFVISTLLRHKTQWAGQRRGGQETGFGEAMSAHKWQTVIGLAAGALTWFYPEFFFWWFMPSLLWLVFSVPLSVLLSMRSPGERLRRAGLLLIPEEADPPPILLALRYYLGEAAPRRKTGRVYSPASLARRFAFSLAPGWERHADKDLINPGLKGFLGQSK